MTLENRSIAMTRPTLEGLPSYALPPAYCLRWYQPGDETAWVAIHLAADPYHHFDIDTFWQEFDRDQTLLVERQAYLCPLLEDGSEGEPIGTASAWFSKQDTQHAAGLIHWVAIHPAYQGKGLAKPLLATVCRRMKELGHPSAFLNTSTARIPAISLYLTFGFIPTIKGDVAATQSAWTFVRSHIDHPAIDSFLATRNPGPVDSNS